MIDLITGGGGFIGRHLVELLRRRGRRVRLLDTDPGEDLGAEVEIIRGSITDAVTVRHALRGIENLYHLAGNPNLWTRHKEDFQKVNYLGTRTVLEEAKAFPLRRIVFTSTESILAAAKQSQSSGYVDEHVTGTLNDMPGPYCRSKFLAEQEACNAAKKGQPVIIVNPTLPVGPGDIKLTPPTKMILGFLNKKYPAYLDCTLNLIDVHDVALGHILAAECGNIGERYILGNENLRLSEILAMLEEITGIPMPKLKIPYGVALAVAAVGEFISDKITGKPPMAPLTGVRLSRRPMSFNSAKAVRELGLSPRPVYQALNRAILWLRERGLVHCPLPRLSKFSDPLPKEGKNFNSLNT